MSLLNQGFPQSLVAPVALAVAQASARPITGAFGTGAAPVDPYAANSFEPDYVADFSATSADFFRVAGVDSDFATAFTSDSEGGGLATQVDSSGNLVWRAHNLEPTADNWTSSVNGTTVGGESVTTSFGLSEVRKFTANTANGYHGPRVTLSGQAAGQQLTSEFIVRAVSGGFFSISHWSGTGPRWATIVVQQSDGSVTSGVSGGTVDEAVATSLGDGYWHVKLATTPTISAWQFVSVNTATSTTLNSSGQTQYVGAGEVIHIAAESIYRSDLGGMAEVPEDQRVAFTPASLFTRHVPTTTAARYLARRRHHRWDGSSYVPTCLHEPVGATNLLDYSRDFTQSAWVAANSGTKVLDATGIDGVQNSAATLSDTDNGDIFGVYDDATVPDDTNPGLMSWYIGYNASPSVYPRLLLFFSGGTSLRYAIVFDPSDGTYVPTNDTPDDVFVERVSPDYWRVIVVGSNNGTGNTTLRAQINPAYNDDGSASANASVTGSTVVDQVQLQANAPLPSSPIPTNGSTVTRTADTLKGKAASLPYSSTAMSMAVAGRYSFAGTGFRNFLGWTQDSNDFMTLGLNGTTLAQRANMNAAGAGVAVSDAATLTEPAFLQAVSMAGRYVDSSAVQAAASGTAATADTSSVPAIPPVSDDDLTVSANGLGAGEVNGTVDTIRLWDEDIAEAGIESGSAGVEIQGLPTISGTEAVGSTLTASAATVVGGPSPSTTWQWQRSANGTSGWADISGATSSTYTLVSADEDQYVRAVQTSSVTAGGDTYTDSANSVASGQVDAERPLNAVTSAVLAFSTARKLRTAYTGDAIRVRRSSDNAEQDIGFDGSGNLDESALTTFVGAGDGLVTTIYDQVGSNDAVMATAADQPRIVASGVVVKMLSKPAIEPVDANDRLVTGSAPGETEKTIIAVADTDSAFSPARIAVTYQGTDGVGTQLVIDHITASGGTLRYFDGETSVTVASVTRGANIYFAARPTTGGALAIGVNGATLTTGGTTTAAATTNNLSVLEDDGGVDQEQPAAFAELVYCDADLRSDYATLISDWNSFWGAY